MSHSNPPPFDCSVVIPARNCLGLLKEALSTVHMQTFDGLKLEIIVVDDGSSDGTSEWLQTQDHVVTIRSEGVGSSNARNLAIHAASSDMVAFLDADDLWWPQKLKHQLAFHKAIPEATFSFTDYVHYNESGQLLGACFDYWQSLLRQKPAQFTVFDQAEAEILAVNMVGTSTVVARRDALLQVGCYRDDLNSAEDWDLWLKLAGIGAVGVSNSVKTSYLVRKGSITSNLSKRVNAANAIISRYNDRQEPEMKKAYKQAIARLNLAKAEISLSKLDYLSALKSHLSALLELRNFWTFRVAIYDLTLLLGFNRKSYSR